MSRKVNGYGAEYALSPTMIAEYQRKLIPLEVMRKSLEEYCTFLKGNKWRIQLANAIES